MPKPFGNNSAYKSPRIVHPAASKSSNSVEPRDAKRGSTRTNPVK